VALPPSGGSLEGEIDWWAGPFEEKIGMRAGQATRHGFIVLCPQWSDGLSYQYGYTAREHQRVLASLRDAQRHFSIDTDRVFIAGHGEGASAAWDIVGSHPDLWAGLVAIGGESRKFVKLYWENLKNVPMYFVTGEIAGTPNPLVRNGDTLNRYMRPQFECMVVSYRGRGEEHFYEEIHHIFDWLQLKSHRRKPPPQDLANVVFRQGDQLFWWLEALELKENIAINPLLWDYTKIGAVPQLAAAVINPTTVRITKAPASRMAVLLQPEMGVDMQERISINWGGRRATTQPGGNLEVMLEDLRQRADRQHPVWDRIEMP
jgi:pimeloyl-ACP methyl ester carboxylesterase